MVTFYCWEYIKTTLISIIIFLFIVYDFICFKDFNTSLLKLYVIVKRQDNGYNGHHVRVPRLNLLDF